MSRVDIAEVRRLHEAAKNGKWVAMTAEHDAEDGIAWAQSADCLRDADHAEYISACHNALPALLDELEAARLEMRRQGSVIAELRGKLDAAWRESARTMETLKTIADDGIERSRDPRTLAAKAAVSSMQTTADWLDARDRRIKLLGAAEELERSTKTLREDLADMNPPEFASRGKVAPGYCGCLQDVADGMEERAAQLRREAEK